MFLSKSVPHHGNGLHGRLMIDILRLDGHDAPVVVDVYIRIHFLRRLIFLLNLCLRVKDDVQVLRLLDGEIQLLLHGLTVEPSV